MAETSFAPPRDARTAPVAGSIYDEVMDRDRCCVVCGRVRDLVLHRRSEPGLAGISAENYSAVCLACAAFLLRQGPPPARYVVRLNHPAWRIGKAALIGGPLLFLALSLALAVIGAETVVGALHEVAGVRSTRENVVTAALVLAIPAFFILRWRRTRR